MQDDWPLISTRAMFGTHSGKTLLHMIKIFVFDENWFIIREHIQLHSFLVKNRGVLAGSRRFSSVLVGSRRERGCSTRERGCSTRERGCSTQERIERGCSTRERGCSTQERIMERAPLGPWGGSSPRYDRSYRGEDPLWGPGGGPLHAAASLRPLQEHVKKRHWYHSTTAESVAWFPHDNHPDLLKELVNRGLFAGCCMARQH